MPAKRSTTRRTTRTKRPLTPRTPSRIKKRTRRARSHHHPELWGLGMVAVGAFLVAVVDLGWSGGVVGAKVADGLHRAGGASAYVIPLALVAVGGLMLVRSSLVDFRPFQTGLAVGVVGLLVTLGSSHGGFLGRVLGGGLAHVAGQTGALIVGLALLIAGSLLVTGASTGALLRRSGRAFVLAGAAARRSIESFERPSRESRQRQEHDESPLAAPPSRPPLVLVDGARAYPDVVTASTEPPALVLHDELEADTDEGGPVFGAPATDRGEYRLPDRSILKASPPVPQGQSDTSAHTADLLVQTLAHFGIDATIVGQIAGPRVVRYELQLAPGTKVSKVAGLKDDLSYALATTEIRILAPIPGKQAVSVEVPNLSPRLVTLGDIYDDLPGAASPLSVCRVDRSGAHATPAHRRHDRLRQVRLHQHHPDVDLAARNPGRLPDDPDRPEAD